MKKFFIFGISTLSMISYSSYAITPIQQTLNNLHRECINAPKVNPHMTYDEKTYHQCLVATDFPLYTDNIFIEKMRSTLAKSDLDIKDNLKLFESISGHNIINANVIFTYNMGEKGPIVDKDGTLYNISIYYAPYTNKMIIAPEAIDSLNNSHTWIGDLKDPDLISAIIQREKNSYESLKKIDDIKNSPGYNVIMNTKIRSIKINIGKNIQFKDFEGYNPKFRLPHENKK